MKHSESFMTSNIHQEVVNVRLRAAKVRFSQVLEYPVHCITFDKERKKEKGNSRVMFLYYHELMSCV